MNDRELLELAAKACGKEIDLDRYDDEMGFIILGISRWWNPLANDGDAFRLAVALDLDLMRTERDIEAIATLAPHARVNVHGIVAPSAIELIGDDKAAATRRAITRAAAAIQEAREARDA